MPIQSEKFQDLSGKVSIEPVLTNDFNVKITVNFEKKRPVVFYMKEAEAKLLAEKIIGFFTIK